MTTDTPRSYHATRPRDWNRCGQAAVATLLDHHGLHPFVSDEVVDRIAERFPPDHLFGLFGTTARQIEAALTAYGLEARVARSRNPAEGRRTWADVTRSVAERLPVIVLLDMGKLGGRPFTAHWAVVYRVENSTVHLANCGRAPRIPEDLFLRAFRCRFMPGGLNHCAVFARRPAP